MPCWGPETFQVAVVARRAGDDPFSLSSTRTLQAMCGSLLQFVAVVAGANIWRPSLVAAVVHPLITAGAIFLATAFLLGQPVLFVFAAIVFATALGSFLTVMAIALLRTPARGMSIHVLRVAVLGLLVTMVLGASLAVTLGLAVNLPTSWSLLALINVHVAWGLGGWALMLVIGVSYLVVPMFQLTPSYPEWLTRLLPVGLFVVLCLWTLQLAPSEGVAQEWQRYVALNWVLLAGLYAATTLWLQSRRRRRQTDVTFILWRGAMLSLLAFAVSWIAFEALPQLGGEPARAALARCARSAGSVHLGDYRHALQDHALSQLAPSAAARWHGPVGAQYETDDSRRLDARPDAGAFHCLGIAACCRALASAGAAGRTCSYRLLSLARMESASRGPCVCARPR